MINILISSRKKEREATKLLLRDSKKDKLKEKEK